MRFRSVLVFLFPLLLLQVQTASAQKRVYASVNPNANALNGTADIYDPQTGRMTLAPGKMNESRERHAAVRLSNGKVLIAGGYDNRYLSSAEIFDPSNGSFTRSGTTLITRRADAASVLLSGGTVLIVGGYNGSYLESAEIYDSGSDTFTSTNTNMTAQRGYPAATVMNSGDVLVTGGYNGSFLNSADVYYLKGRSFISSGSTMSDARAWHTGTLLPDGTVLIAGGCTAAETGEVHCNKYLSSADTYDEGKDKFTSTSAMNTARANHTATLLADGKVLIAGGTTQGGALVSTAEIYDPATRKFTTTGELNVPRIYHTAALLPDGKVLIAGGFSDHRLDSSEIYDPQTGKFTVIPSTMAYPRSHHTATALLDGKVLLAGGENSDLMLFDVNITNTDNVSPNIVFSADSQRGYVAYTGSGYVLSFSAESGSVLNRLKTGGRPIWTTLLPDNATLAVVSALDNQIFMIDANTLTLKAAYSFAAANFGYGSMLTLSPDGTTGYISSSGTGEVIKFEMSTGKELGRLKSLGIPGQITITKDGKTLIVVDTGQNELVFADASLMTAKYKASPAKDFPASSFTIFNRAVLSSDEASVGIASQNTLFYVFQASNGTLTQAVQVGVNPGYTTLTPGGLFWLVLSDGIFSAIPTWDPESVRNDTTVQGAPLSSANIVISPDIRYAFYTSSTADRVYQHNIGTGAVVGSFPVGNEILGTDMPSSVAFTPDYRTLAVVDFSSNQLDLLTDETVLKNTKFQSEQEKFTGISVVNLAPVPANVTFTARSDAGATYSSSADNFQNPVTVRVPANGQRSVDVSQIFHLNTNETNSGYLVVSSDQPAITGYSNAGQIHSDFLSAYLSNVQGIPLNTDYGESLHDWIIPEIPEEQGTSAELNFVNPNYNQASYDVTHYGSDGTVMEQKNGNTIAGANRQAKQVSDLVTSVGVGQVLIVGGFDSLSTLNSAELFSLSNNFGATATPGEARQGHTATMLRNEKVLIAGGRNGSVTLSSASLYDAVGHTFYATGGTMNAERYRHTATLLPNGKVLLAGGQNSSGINRSAELYDPSANQFTPTGTMSSPRDAHTATLLPNGKVLISGGLDGNATSSTAEIYDPATEAFTATGSMAVGRAFHTAVLLNNGKVLIAGGYNGTYLSSAELYDPVTGLFTSAGQMTTARSRHTATLLLDGTVLIAGGMNSTGTLPTAEVYDPQSGLFISTANNMTSPRSSHAAALYSTGATAGTANTKVLLAGGTDGTDTLRSADTYDPLKRTFTQSTGDMTAVRQGHTATTLTGGAQGYLRAKSAMGVLFTEIYNYGGADAGINGIDVDSFAGVTKIYSPQFAILPEYQTLLNVINANDNPAVVRITVHAPDGRVLLDPLARTLPANSQIKGSLLDLFDGDLRLLNQTGYIEVVSSRDKIVGTVSFTNVNHDFLAAFELSGNPMSNFLFPLVSEDTEYATGVALLNAGGTAANVRLELWGPLGTLDSTASIVVAPHTRTAQTLSQLFPGMRDHRVGNVRVWSDQPLHSFAIMYSLDLHFITAITAVPYPGQ